MEPEAEAQNRPTKIIVIIQLIWGRLEITHPI